jgi:hypothetical protein
MHTTHISHTHCFVHCRVTAAGAARVHWCRLKPWLVFVPACTITNLISHRHWRVHCRFYCLSAARYRCCLALWQCSLFQHAHNSSHDIALRCPLQIHCSWCYVSVLPQVMRLVVVVPAHAQQLILTQALFVHCRFTVAGCSSIGAASRQWL